MTKVFLSFVARLDVEERIERQIRLHDMWGEYTAHKLDSFGGSPAIVEGGTFLPDRISKIGDVDRAVCLVAEDSDVKYFKNQRLQRDDHNVAQAAEFEATLDQHLTRESREASARLISKEIARRAVTVGIKVFKNRRSRSVEDLTELVRQHLEL